MTGALPPAFILFGGFMARYFPGIWAQIRIRGLALLIVDDLDEVLKEIGDQFNGCASTPFNIFNEVAHVMPVDMAGMLQQVSRWAERYDIRGVASTRENRVEQASLAADMLNLPSPGLRAARICTNKYLQRLYLKEWSPPFLCITPAQRSSCRPPPDIFPAVLKPVGRSSSLGVQRILSQSELTAAVQEYPDEEVLILEGLLQGREYSIEALIQQRKVIYENITQKVPKPGMTRYFVELGHSIPATNLTEEEADRLLSAHRAILKRLDFQDGYGGAEYLVTNDGKIYLAEIAARSPGDGILPLYLLATGHEMEEAIVTIALGVETKYAPVIRHAKVIYLEHPHGRFRGIATDGLPDIQPVILPERVVRPALQPGAIEDPPTVREILSAKAYGDLLGEMANAYDRSVSVLFDARTGAELSAFEADLLRRCRIIVEPL